MKILIIGMLVVCLNMLGNPPPKPVIVDLVVTAKSLEIGGFQQNAFARIELFRVAQQNFYPEMLNIPQRLSITPSTIIVHLPYADVEIPVDIGQHQFDLFSSYVAVRKQSF